MKIIKRNGSEADFDLNKIVIAVTKANNATEKGELSASEINDIAEYVEFKMAKANRALSVEEIQDIVEDQIMAKGAFEVAKRYVRYRYTRSLVRKANTTDNQILSLIGSRTGTYPFPRCRLFCTAYAQLRPCKSRGYASKRHRYFRNDD